MFNKTLFVFSVLCVLVSCGSSETDSALKNTPLSSQSAQTSVSKTAHDRTTVVEGNTMQLSLDVSPGQAVIWTQVSGPKTLFTRTVAGELELLAPQVPASENITIDARVMEGVRLVDHHEWQVEIADRNIPELEIQPEPNVFSSPRLEKHDGKLYDEAGIPLLERPEGQFHYPVTISAYAYDVYHRYYRAPEPGLRERFLTNAVWLRDNCIYTDYGFCTYRSNFPLPSYQLESDWTSAMGQGKAISSLIAAHYLTGDASFGQVAYDALAAFAYPVSFKGLRVTFGSGIWFEEYGSEFLPTHVLNGYLFALSGLHDFVQAYDEDFAHALFEEGVQSLSNNIDLFDLQFTSRYDYSSLNQIASTKSGPDGYHELHIFQLGWAYNVTGNEKFKDYAHRFLMQDMAGLRTVSKLYERSIEIHSIDLPPSGGEQEYDAEKLHNANWSWDDFWLTQAFPADLTLTLNRDILASGMLTGLVFTSVREQDTPMSFSVYEVGEEGDARLLRAGISRTNTPHETFNHIVGDFPSHTVTYNLQLPVTSNRLLIRIDGSRSGTVRLRELDVHYPRPSLLDQVLNYYQFP